MRFLKYLVIALAALIVLAVVLPYIVPLDGLKPRIIATVDAKTGKHLRIDGHIHASLFPTAGLHMEDAALFTSKESEAKKEAPIVQFKSFDAKVDLAKAITQGDIDILALSLVEPTAVLSVDKSGIPNWQVMPAAQAEKAVSEEPKPAPEGEKKEATDEKAKAEPLSLTVRDVRITGGNITYANAQGGQSWKIEKLDFTGNMVAMDAPLSFNASAIINGEKFAVKATVDSIHSMLKQGFYKLDLNIDSSPANFAFSGSAANGALQGHLGLSTPSIKKLMAWLQPGAKPIDVPTALSFSLNADADISPAFMNLSAANITLDGNTLNGKLGFQPAHGLSPIQLNGDLTTDGLDFRPYQKAAQSGGFSLVSDAVAAPAAKWSTDPIDFSALKMVEGNVRLRFGSIQMQQLHLEKGSLDTNLNLGQLKLDLIDTQMYDGEGNISAIITASEHSVKARMMFKDINAEALLKDVAQYDGLSGKGNLQFAFATAGNSQSDMVSALQGGGKVSVLNGAVKGYNVADMVRNIKGITSPTKTAGQETDFAELSGSFNIKQGVLTNDDLAMKAPLLRLSGKGSLNLPERTVNYRLVPEIVDTLKGQGGKDKQGLAVPLLVTGSMDSPNIQPDVKGAVQDIINDPSKAKAQLKSAKDAIKQSGVKDSLKNLKGLFKQPKN